MEKSFGLSEFDPLFSDMFKIMHPEKGESFFDYLKNEVVSKAWKGFNDKLEEHLKNNLALQGFIFDNRDEFLDFLSKRVTRIGFSNKPNDFDYYLDYASENGGILLCSSNEDIDFDYDKNKITVTVGKRIS